MATSSVIGALRVVLGVDTASFEDGLKKSLKGVDSFTSAAMSQLAVAAAAAVAAGTALAYSMKSAIDNADQLGKTAQKIGVPIEALSALAYGANLADVSMETLTKSMVKLSKTMVEAGAKPTEDAARAFQALGVSATDSTGKLKSVDVLMADLAESFAGFKDGAAKTAAAVALFGRGGAEMIPLLNQGRAGFASMKDEAEKFGLILTDKVTGAAQEFNDNLKRLDAVKQGIVTRIMAGLLPALELFTKRMVDSKSSAESLEKKVSTLTSVFDVIARTIMVVADNMGTLLTLFGLFIASQLAAAVINMGIAFFGLAKAIAGATFASVALVAVKKITIGRIAAFAAIVIFATGNLEAFKKMLGDVGDAIAGMLPEDAGGGIMGFLKSMGINLDAFSKAQEAVSQSQDKTTKSQKDLNYALLAGKSAVEQYIDGVKKQITTQEVEIATFGKMVGVRENLTVVEGAFQVAQEKGTKLTQAQTDAVLKLGNAAGANAIKLEGLKLSEEVMTSWEKQNKEIEKTKFLLDNDAISAETFKRKMDAIQAPQLTKMIDDFSNLGKQIEGLSIDTLNNMTTSLADAALGTKSMSEAFDEFAKKFIRKLVEMTIQMTIMLPIAIALKEAITFGIGGGVGGLGGLFSMFGGFQSGGTFQVGGAGGPDSQLVAFRATPGEMVSVETPSQQQTSGGTSVVNLSLQGDSYSKGSVREMFDMINAGIRDGYRIRVAS